MVQRMTSARLKTAVAARFTAVNGDHPMSAEDDAYVSEWYVPLEQLTRSVGVSADELRRLMLANRLPLPSYIRSDGTQMVARDLYALVERASGVDRLPGWFGSQFRSPEEAVDEWDAYLSGQYVCLRDVTPENMQRKGELVAAIHQTLAMAEAESDSWLESLHALVDELDALEPPFTPYDRLRFGGPVSRDTLIDDVRARFPRTAVLRG
jgi:Family of unknown function (DUF6058)